MLCRNSTDCRSPVRCNTFCRSQGEWASTTFLPDTLICNRSIDRSPPLLDCLRSEHWNHSLRVSQGTEGNSKPQITRRKAGIRCITTRYCPISFQEVNTEPGSLRERSCFACRRRRSLVKGRFVGRIRALFVIPTKQAISTYFTRIMYLSRPGWTIRSRGSSSGACLDSPP